MMKKLLTMALALVMTMSLAVGVTAFASEDTANSTMTIKIVRENENATQPVDCATFSVSYNTGDTLYDVIDNKFGDDAVWDPVDILDPSDWSDTGLDGHVLKSLTFTDNAGEEQTWTNNGQSEEGSTAVSGKYSGQSWVYTYDSFLTGDNEDEYLDYVGANGGTLTLNFQYSSFTWGNWTGSGTQE